MKKSIVFLLLSIIFIQCKQKKESVTNRNTEETKMVNKKENLVGGWKAVEVNNKIRELANYVVIEKNISIPIKEILSAKEQVVSGKNYGFELLLTDNERFEVVVYENIKKVKEITTFKKLSN